MTFNFKYLVVYPLTAFTLGLTAFIVYMMIDPGAAEANTEHRQPAARATPSGTPVSRKTLFCNNFRTSQDVLNEAEVIVEELGVSLGKVADARNPYNLRRKYMQDALRLFDDPDHNTIEVVQSVDHPEQKTAVPVREYFDRFLNQDKWTYQIIWTVDTATSKLDLQEGVPQCEVNIRQQFTRMKKGVTIPGPNDLYEDFTAKTVFLFVRESTNCKDQENKNNASKSGCCTIKVGNTVATQIYERIKQ